MRILVGSNHPLTAVLAEKRSARPPQLEIVVLPESELHAKVSELKPHAIVVAPGADGRSPPQSASATFAPGAQSLILFPHELSGAEAPVSIVPSIGLACAFLLTTAGVQETLQVIEEHERLCPHASAELAPAPTAATVARREHLTPRESEILAFIAQELSSKEIAQFLRISPRTVSAHRFSLMKKLRIHTTAGLVRYALKARLVGK